MTSPSTADPKGARDHARAMAGTRVAAMPTVPASDADHLPDGVSPADMVWEETIAAGGYSSKELRRGTRLRLLDLEGDACVSIQIFNAECTTERLNVADTVKVQWNAYLQRGRLLLSDMGRVMMTMVADEAATHDALCGTSNEAGNARRYGSGLNSGPFPNGRDRLILGVARFGLGRKDVHPCINFFKEVRIAADGGTTLHAGPYMPGRSLVLRAEMDVIVAMANCPHVLDQRHDYRVTPVRVSAWRGAAATEQDEFRVASPEALRAFLNTEEYLCR